VNTTDAGLDQNLQLLPSPTVAAESDRQICLGSSLNILPTYSNVSGSSVTYQWYYEGSPLGSQRSAQLSIASLQNNQAGRYYVAVNNGCGPVSGTPFNVNVLELPVIKTQPTASVDL